MKKRLLPILAMFCMIVNSVWADGFTVERAVNLGQLDSWTDISKFQWQEIDHGVLDNRADTLRHACSDDVALRLCRHHRCEECAYGGGHLRDVTSYSAGRRTIGTIGIFYHHADGEHPTGG